MHTCALFKCKFKLTGDLLAHPKHLFIHHVSFHTSRRSCNLLFVLFLTVTDYTHDTTTDWNQEYSVSLRWKEDSLASWPNHHLTQIPKEQDPLYHVNKPRLIPYWRIWKVHRLLCRRDKCSGSWIGILANEFQCHHPQRLSQPTVWRRQ